MDSLGLGAIERRIHRTTFGLLRLAVDGLGLASQALSSSVNPDIGTLDTVLRLRQIQVVLERLLRVDRGKHLATL